MAYYLGLAKSSLDLKGAKGQKIELDLLRLIYLIKTNNDEIIFGFIMVYDDDIVNRCEKWIEKYNAFDLLGKSIFIDKFRDKMTSRQISNFNKEKENNRIGNTLIASTLSNADSGKEMSERFLHERMLLEIRKKFPKVIIEDIKQDEKNNKFEICWDGFYLNE